MGTPRCSTLARRQLRNTSGMIAFQTEHAPAVARRLAERLKVVKYAVSLGKPYSLVFYLPTEDLQRTSFQLPPGLLERYRGKCLRILRFLRSSTPWTVICPATHGFSASFSAASAHSIRGGTCSAPQKWTWDEPNTHSFCTGKPYDYSP